MGQRLVGWMTCLSEMSSCQPVYRHRSVMCIGSRYRYGGEIFLVTMVSCFVRAFGSIFARSHSYPPTHHHLLSTSHVNVKFDHPCALYCKVCHRHGRPVFINKPGIVEPSARQLRAKSSDCLQFWSNTDTFRTFGFASPTDRSSGSCAHRATHADLETGSYLPLSRGNV